MAFDTDRAYRLSPAATLRPEPFGALAYHFGNRRLSFLKSRQLVAVVRLLDSYDSAADALDAAGAGRVVCLIDPVGDVYTCPFAIHDAFKAGTVRAPGGFARVWRTAPLFAELRTETSGGACRFCSEYSACQGGCMAAKFFTGLPLDGPDPECVRGHGAGGLTAARHGGLPRAGKDHSHSGRPSRPSGRSGVVALGMPTVSVPAKFCDSSPLAATS